MSRLLHAAARGARVQGYICGKWLLTAGICPDVDRIHPEDEHLQYGPISSALRKKAEEMSAQENITDIPYFEFSVCVLTLEEQLSYALWTDKNRSLFLLILAEALADEGL